MDIRRSEQIKIGQDVVGNKANIRVVKNKVAPPFKLVSVEIIYGKGVSFIGEVIDMGVEFDLIEKSGSWYSYQGERIGQGREAVRTFLEDNPKITEVIAEQIRDRIIPARMNKVEDNEVEA